MERVEAGLLVPGRGEPVRDGVVVWDGPTITYAGPAAGAPPAGQTPSTRAAAVLPGLWDCHGHLLGIRTLDLGRLPLEPVALRAARCPADLRAALDAGVTSVREAGGLGVHLARAVAEGTVEGPAIYGAGAVLSVTGGHGDLHSLPLPWMAEFAGWGGELRLCDGVDGCMKAVREQLRRNARLIKVCASGGVLSDLDDPVHQQFTAAELRAVVEVAGLAERVVAAHCHGKPGIMAALQAGVHTIEHGTYLDEEACAAMRETGAILVPTRTIIQETQDSAAVPPFAQRKLAAIADRHATAVALAHERGVTIAMGTDISISGAELANSWGRNGRELPLLAHAGLTPLEAIQAATANGPLTLGPQAPRSGQLAEDYDADLITLDGDPLADITILADPAHIAGVWKAGRRVKGSHSNPTEHR
ncbi:MAG TPA: amidohydrolase family protein [Streptosporangiaceae bacterium]|jgi:imidazolonepropionase-like amidohydrolase|nr:amidohydrolase family protein [Streptosporangiaceae bacterium]